MKRLDLEQWRAREVARLLALVEAERRYYQEIVAIMPVGLAVLDADLSLISVNRSFREVFGLSERTLSRLRLGDLFAGGEVDNRVEDVLETGKAQRNLTVQYVTPEGPRPLRLSIEPFRGWDEEANSEALLVVQDLEVQASAPELTVERPDGQLLDNIDAIVWERDPESLQFTSVGGRSEEILGYTAEQSIEGPDFDAKRIHPEDREWVVAFYRATLSSLDSRSCEYRALRADGRTVWLRDVIRVVRDEQGSPVRLSGITVDVNAQKVRDEQIVQAEKMAGLSRLASKVTHDCNNLLMIVSGYSEELLDKLPADHPSRGDVEEILTATDRLSGLTTELLRFTRRPILSPTVFSLNSLLESFEPGVRREMGSSATLELLPEPGLGNISADWDQIGDALLTLVRTCSGSVPADGRLTIETKNVELADGSPHAGESLPPGQYVSLAIIHHGTGFDEETRMRLFEPFFASSRIGVDLSSIYTLIRNSGGDIRVSNGAAEGMRFTIYLPAVGQPETATSETVEAAKESAPVKETVLVAEDEAGIRALVRKILNKQGYTVLEASNGQEALRVAASHSQPIHLLLTDVVMPGMNGRELLEQLTATRPNLKALFISGYTGDDLTDRGSLPEGAEFLQKPFSLAVLIEKVRTALDK